MHEGGAPLLTCPAGFNLHFVRSDLVPYSGGEPSVPAFAAAFDAHSNALLLRGAADAWMWNALVMWVDDLAPYAAALARDGVPLLQRRWPDSALGSLLVARSPRSKRIAHGVGWLAAATARVAPRRTNAGVQPKGPLPPICIALSGRGWALVALVARERRFSNYLCRASFCTFRRCLTPPAPCSSCALTWGWAPTRRSGSCPRS